MLPAIHDESGKIPSDIAPDPRDPTDCIGRKERRRRISRCAMRRDRSTSEQETNRTLRPDTPFERQRSRTAGRIVCPGSGLSTGGASVRHPRRARAKLARLHASFGWGFGSGFARRSQISAERPAGRLGTRPAGRASVTQRPAQTRRATETPTSTPSITPIRNAATGPFDANLLVGWMVGEVMDTGAKRGATRGDTGGRRWTRAGRRDWGWARVRVRVWARVWARARVRAWADATRPTPSGHPAKPSVGQFP